MRNGWSLRAALHCAALGCICCELLQPQGALIAVLIIHKTGVHLHDLVRLIWMLTHAQHALLLTNAATSLLPSARRLASAALRDRLLYRYTPPTEPPPVHLPIVPHEAMLMLAASSLKMTNSLRPEKAESAVCCSRECITAKAGMESKVMRLLVVEWRNTPLTPL